MIAIGVDPGIHGAVALVDVGKQRLLECVNLPTRSNGSKGRVKSMIDANALARLLDGWASRHGNPGRAAVERMFAKPTRPDAPPEDRVKAAKPTRPDAPPEDRVKAASSVTLLSMGYTAGAVEGVLWCLFGDVPGFDVLRPMPRQWKASYSLTDDKSASVLIARRMFRETPARYRHDLAEASLLAHWAGGALSIPTTTSRPPSRRSTSLNEPECAFP